MNRRTFASLAVLLISPSAHAQVTPDSPSCLAAMQVIGHNGEAVLQEGDAYGPIRNLDDVQCALQEADMSESFLKIAKRVAAGDGPYCKQILAKLPRLYPAYRDDHDHMSTERIITVIGMLRIQAAGKAQLEAALSRDISH